MVVTKVRQVKSLNKLSDGIKYIEDGAKTIGANLLDSDLNFPVKIINGKLVSQLISGHLVINVESADLEFRQLKQLANLQKGRPINNESLVDNDVLAHHIIQSFSPEDNLTAEQVHEIGRKTALELTGGSHQFVVATHMDKGHLHNHIYINSTNSITLNKFRWQKGTKKSLEQISDKYADLAGAKILEAKNQFGHKEYSAYQRENVFKLEIKSRLEFLLKHSTSLEDFKSKAKALNLNVDFSGKYAKYKLLDKEQKRNTRDSSLSKKGRYSLESVEKQIAKNEVVYTLDEIKSEYDKLQSEKADDFEIRVKIEPWQVEAKTETGIYLQMQYGIANQGTVKIPKRLVDELEDGSFDIFIKKSDFFYFINPDNSSSNKFMKGSTLINQLAYESGEYILRKNPNISKLDLLVREYNYLVSHNISESEQFLELRNRFMNQIEETQESLNYLDEKIERLNKIASALEDYHSDNPIDKEIAKTVLIELSISLDMDIKEIEKQVIEVSIERKGLKETFDKIVKDFTQYEKIEKNSQARRYDVKHLTEKVKEEIHR
ncbi:TPA: relaxase/mobilization nuclease domain-containing protein [Streptococcus pyogenes]|uniref:helical hairpin domain-containing protein n=1 Tax=Streptococcus dysgalactiae TaxID=1334 RepID=UPI002B1C4E76|nr:relaxase/mobilization nuclease domain-containing protein [Streptococcus pyogenes]HEP4643541.1 relaxase/mobilization nuclease domain-containing protein [Streptococcus pyogenes]HEP4646822.1 relaxase/mobilization nuclease domain-containing protein [Streptococcus pyogenes]HEP4648622.1 relaxase/mobilization nuclease domain-containing protein [Streptococcus pyogenes]HEP4650369.1 relaxase/mobilization nuclease domain-containing protein [Streptococcus pyogenes]